MTDATSGLLTPGTLCLFSKKTRDQILATSLVMFNQRGFGAVTTASIAEQTCVLEGTLWYHFRSKKDILAAHIALLQTVFAQENATADSGDAEVIIDGIFRSYDVIWDFRYLLRDDFNSLLKSDDEELTTVLVINEFLDRWTEGRMLHAAEHGLIDFQNERSEAVSEIILVLGRYWMDFSHKKYPEVPGTVLRLKGISHIFTVLKPYLSKAAKELVSDRLPA
ncbi:MAG: TetR family transcriptional regulator [Crocinitomicaceae bacterium]|nr:TetR family transcriptional regulator [Crocinitomicaceae bacterium]